MTAETTKINTLIRRIEELNVAWEGAGFSSNEIFLSLAMSAYNILRQHDMGMDDFIEILSALKIVKFEELGEI